MSHRAMFLVSMLSAGTSLLHAQTMVEYGAAAGRAGAAGGAANFGKSITDAFGKVQQSLTGAAKVDEVVKPRPLPPVTTGSIPAVTPKAAPPEPVLPPDLKELVLGLERADMLKKVGKPAMSFSLVESGVLVETCSYKSGSDSITVILHDGKVSSISGLESLTAQ
jgi:hypothetical protein